MINYREHIKKNGLKSTWIAQQLEVSKSLFSMFLSQQRNLHPEKIHKLNKILNINGETK